MITIKNTLRFVGVKITGTEEDLGRLYHNLTEVLMSVEEEDPRSDILSSFTYEIRKAKDGSRGKKVVTHYGVDGNLYIPYFSTQINWVTWIFVLEILREYCSDTCLLEQQKHKFIYSTYWYLEALTEQALLKNERPLFLKGRSILRTAFFLKDAAYMREVYELIVLMFFSKHLKKIGRSRPKEIFREIPFLLSLVDSNASETFCSECGRIDIYFNLNDKITEDLIGSGGRSNEYLSNITDQQWESLKW